MKLVINYDYQNIITINRYMGADDFRKFIVQISQLPVLVFRDAFHKTRDEQPMYLFLIGKTSVVDQEHLKSASKEMKELIEQIFQYVKKSPQPTTAILVHQDQDRFFKISSLQVSKT